MSCRPACRILCLLLLAWCASCGSGATDPQGPTGAPGEPAAFERYLTLEATEGSIDLPRPAITGELSVHPEAGHWELEEGVRRRLAGQATKGDLRPFMAVVPPKRGTTLAWRAPLDAASFNQVVVELKTRRYRSLALAAVRQGQVVAKTKPVDCSGLPTPQNAVLDFSGIPRPELPIDELHLIVGQGPSEMNILGVKLVQRPLITRLAGRPGAPKPLELELESRWAVGLSSLHPVQARLPEGARGTLALSYGLPKELQTEPVAQLYVHLVRGDKVLESNLLDLSPEQGRGPEQDRQPWRDARIVIEEPVASDTWLRFELRGEGPRESVCALGIPEWVRTQPTPPTVLLITSDTHRADYLGAARSGIEVSTPFLDSLAERGVLFSDCTSATNVTNPSHIALMTATAVRDTGIVDNATPLAAEATTLAERFQAAGFVTYAAISAAHLTHERSGLGQGFDRVTSPEFSATTRDSSDTISALRPWVEEAAGRPLFVWLHTFDAHGPYEAPEVFNRRYYSENRDPYDPSLPELPAAKKPRWDRKVRDLAYVESRYRAEVSYLDERLAELVGMPRFQDAVIGFTADHGECMDGPRQYWSHTGLAPSTLNVPLILAWPEAPGGQRVDRAVTYFGLGRTLLDLSGLSGVEFPGTNLLDQAEDADPAPRFAIEMGGKSASIRSGPWFLVLHLRDREADGPLAAIPMHQHFLYDLKADPRAEKDVAGDQAQVARDLRRALVRWLHAASGSRWGVQRSVSATELAKLAELGYSDGDVGAESGDWMPLDCECEPCAKSR